MSGPDPVNKRKLLVILGAGSSIPCGMPSVTELNGRMKEWSKEWADPPVFPPGAIGEGVFNDMWGFVERYLAEKPRPQLGLTLGYERILGEMISLASWTAPSPFGNPLRAAVCDPHTSPKFSWPPGKEGDHYYQHLILNQLGFLLRKLAEFMRGRCRDFHMQTQEFATYRQIVDALRDEFEVGIYTLNYDNLALRAWPEAFTGFQAGRFDSQAIATRQSWEFIYHLHGSVHYSLTGMVSQNEMTWIDDLSANFEDSRHLMPNMASNFIPIIPTTLIAGGYKLDQLLADPAQSFYASLVRHMHTADAILIAGYGFGDVHVNRALKNKFDIHLSNPNTRPPVAVITKTAPQAGTIGEREGHELYAWELTHSLNSRFSRVGSALQHISLETLIANHAFEYDNIQRTAVSHVGLLEMVPHLTRLIQHLAS